MATILRSWFYYYSQYTDENLKVREVKPLVYGHTAGAEFEDLWTTSLPVAERMGTLKPWEGQALSVTGMDRLANS